MADTDLSEKYITDAITCQLCLKFFKHPIKLDKCFHTVCESCIDHLLSTKQNRCPICLTTFTRDDLSDDLDKAKFLKNNTPPKQLNTLKEETCFFCKCDKFSYKCLHCQRFACESCCEKDDENISPCAASRSHTFYGIGLPEEKEQQLKNALDIKMETLEKIKQNCEDLASYSETIKEQKKSLLRRTDIFCENLSTEVNRLRNQIIDEIEDVFDTEKKKLQIINQELDANVSRFKRKIKRSFDNLNRDSAKSEAFQDFFQGILKAAKEVDFSKCEVNQCILVELNETPPPIERSLQVTVQKVSWGKESANVSDTTNSLKLEFTNLEQEEMSVHSQNKKTNEKVDREHATARKSSKSASDKSNITEFCIPKQPKESTGIEVISQMATKDKVPEVAIKEEERETKTFSSSGNQISELYVLSTESSTVNKSKVQYNELEGEKPVTLPKPKKKPAKELSTEQICGSSEVISSSIRNNRNNIADTSSVTLTRVKPSVTEEKIDMEASEDLEVNTPAKDDSNSKVKSEVNISLKVSKEKKEEISSNTETILFEKTRKRLSSSFSDTLPFKLEKDIDSHSSKFGWAHSLSIIGEKTWCIEGNKINIIAADGKIEKAIIHKGIKNAQAVTQLDSGVLVLATTASGLLLVEEGFTDCSQVRDIAQGSFVSIASSGKYVYALESKEGKVVVFRQNERDKFDLEHVKSIDVPYKVLSTHDTLIALHNAHNIGEMEKFLVCSHMGDKIYCMDINGKVIQKYGNSGNRNPGDINKPRLCCTDLEHSIVVADTGNKRMQVLKRHGEWYVNPGFKGVDKPWDAVADIDGSLWVLCKNGNIIVKLKPTGT